MQVQSQLLFHVIRPGILTTFQDMGRSGYQQYGVPVSGAMDRFALQLANILVGNSRSAACLEITLLGPVLKACTTLTIAITGADLEAKVNERNIPLWTTVSMHKGDKLTFGKHQSGVRAYIAVAGGFEAPGVFGSMATDVKAGFGAPIERSEHIYGFPVDAPSGIGLQKRFIPTYKKAIEVAVVEGPHTHLFTKEGHDHFFSSIHTVDANSNRMGYRLTSNKVEVKKDAEIFSDAVPFGGVQIPSNGQPIILMADRQTTGGYPRIGTVISSDLHKIAQLVPKGEITFKPISVEVAQERAIKMEKFLREVDIFRKAL
ncbi:biotin-dependent carboxyltransferase family protein [Virgibacillus sp. NKC19-3]|uniref:5-oxoprolinase subunit C family protein n=1 Tax=Virgibacillus saliphilus TaxID=2831674 RepID=UPI001C9B132A|nr:biotin-dependent carboxyltransferase family protein [Virgibacillus sp. NKC19-3]MBY7144141.1 biotin-dependent carboxyltransferase family protein [Virgibacillus sp. NKC19-3]